MPARRNRGTTTLLVTAIDFGLLVLRIAVAAAMLQAGLIKAFDFTTTDAVHGDGRDGDCRRSPPAMVTAAEIAGGIALLLGFADAHWRRAAVIAAILERLGRPRVWRRVLVGSVQHPVLVGVSATGPALHRRWRATGVDAGRMSQPRLRPGQ